MAQIQRGFTFQVGSTGEIPEFHQLVDSAILLPGFITEHPLAAPAAIDSFIFNKGGALKRCNLQQIINAFPRGGGGNIFALRKLGTDAQSAAAGNDVRFPARLTGIRKANGTAADTVADSQDLTLAPVNLANGTVIDWSDGSAFYATLTGNKTYSFVGQVGGQTIKVGVILNGHTLAFTGASVTTLGSGTTYAYVELTLFPGHGIQGFRVNR